MPCAPVSRIPPQHPGGGVSVLSSAPLHSRDNPMRASTHNIFFRVVVRRRMLKGPAPFGWELHSGDTIVPLHVSSSGFDSMEAAYAAGQTKLADLLNSKKSGGKARAA